MRKFYTLLLSLLCFLLVVFEGQSQSVLKEINLPSGKIKNIQAFASEDNFYLLYDVADPTTDDFLKITHQVDARGVTKEMHYDHKDNAVLLGVQDESDSSWFYYLTETDRSLSVGAMCYNHKTAKGKWQSKAIKIENRLIGVIFDKTLSILAYDEEMNQLQYVAIDRMRRADNRSFEVPFNLKPFYKDIRVIRENNELTTSEQSAGKIKLYKKDEKLILTIDQTHYQNSKSTPTTEVLFFDVRNGKQTTKKFPIETKNSFRSFIHNELMYRATPLEKSVQLEVFNIVTGKSARPVEILGDSTPKRNLYLRNGKTLRTIENAGVSNPVPTAEVPEPYVLVVSEGDSCTTTRVLGSYTINDDDPTINPGMLVMNPMAILLADAVNTVIPSNREPTGTSRYFYANDRCASDEDSSHTTSVKSRRQRIDDYEVSLDKEKIVYKYKGYAEFQEHVIGIYFDAKALKLVLVKF